MKKKPRITLLGSEYPARFREEVEGERFVLSGEPAVTGRFRASAFPEDESHQLQLLEAKSKDGSLWRVVMIQAGWSLNERYYPANVLEAARALYEDVRVHAFKFEGAKDPYGHLPFCVDKLPDDCVHNLVGVCDNVKFETITTDDGRTLQGLTADFKITDERIMKMLSEFWAINKKGLLGFSHDVSGTGAPGEIEGKYGEIVTAINTVYSLDMVSRPAAGGLLQRKIASVINKGGEMKKFLQKLMSGLKLESLATLLRAKPELLGKGVKVEGKKDEDLFGMLQKTLAGMGEGIEQAKLDELVVPPGVVADIVALSQADKPAEALKVVFSTLDDGIKSIKAADEKPAGDPAPDPEPEPAKDPAPDPAPEPAKDGEGGDKPEAKSKKEEQLDALLAKAKETGETLAKQVQEGRQRESVNILDKSLSDSQLPEGFQKVVRKQFEGKVATQEEIDAAISEQKVAIDSLSASVSGGSFLPSGGVEVGRNTRDQMLAATELMINGVPDKEKEPKLFAECEGVEPFLGPQEMYRAFTGDRRLTMRVSESHMRHQEMVTSDYAFALGTSTERRLVRAYKLVPDIMTQLVNVVPINSFKQQTRPRMAEFANLSTVAEAGTYTEIATPSEENPTYTATKRGNKFFVTWEMVLADDIRAIRAMPVAFGRAANRTLQTFIGDLLLSYTSAINDTNIYDSVVLYHAGSHANTATDALTSASLTACKTAMAIQQDPDSKATLDLEPKFLVVPAALSATADILLKSERLKGSTDGGDANVHLNTMERVRSPYLRGDVTNWYAVADPTQHEGIEVGFVGGREMPDMFLQDQPQVGTVFTDDEITWKVRHAYGGAVIDYRPLYGGIVAG